MSTSESRSAVVLELAEEFLERYRLGERPGLKEYIDLHPELEREIREVFPAMAMMENIAIRDESLAPGVTQDGPPIAAPRLDQLGDFRIIREIGHGGMGIVYEAEQISLGRHVALKVLPRQLVRDAVQLQRFEREARAAAKLHHTNIVPVFGVGEHDGTAYYVMQYIQGLGLDEVIDEIRRLSSGKELGKSIPPGGQLHVSRRDATAREVARSLITGRFEQPEQNVATLDRGLAATRAEGEPGTGLAATMACEPAAITVPASPSDYPPPSGIGGRLSDSFTVSSSSAVLPGKSSDGKSGRSRTTTYWHSVAQIGAQAAEALEYAHKQGVLHRDIKPSNLLLDVRGTVWVTDFGLAKADDQKNLTQSGDILGTVRYMAPEAFEGKTDPKSDVYSLGLTLYEMLALRPAFDEKDRHRLLKQVMHEVPRRLETVSPDIPRDLATIVQKAIDREPEHRYTSAAELGTDLLRFLNDEPIRARHILLRERLSRWCRRNPVVAGLTAALIGLLALVSIASVVAAAYFNRLANREAESALSERIALVEARTAHKEALKALGEAHAQSARLAVERGLGLVDQHEADRGLLWLTRALTLDPKNVSGLHQAIRINLTRAAREQITLPRAVLRPQAAAAAPPFERERNDITKVAFSPNGEVAATANRHGTIQLWDPATGRPIGKPFGPTGRKARLSALAFTPDGRGILVGTTMRQPGDPNSSGDAQAWDAATGQPRSGPVKLPGWVSAFSPDGLLLAAIRKDPNSNYEATQVGVFEVDTGRQVGAALVHDRPIYEAVAFSPDSQKLLTGDSPPDRSGQARARLWDVTTGRLIWASIPHPGWHIYGVAFSPDGKLVATAANDRHVRIFDATDGKAVGAPMENNDQVNVVAFSPDGRTVAAGMATVTAGKEGRNEIRLWDRKTGKPLGPDLPHDGGILALAFSPDGICLASSSTDGVARLWTLPDGPTVGWPIGSGGFRSVAFTPDGRVLLTGGFGNAVEQYDPTTGHRAGPTLNAGKFIRSIAVHPSGRTVAIGAGLPISTNQSRPDFGEVQLWDRVSGRQLAAPLKHRTDRPDHLAFLPDGQTLLTTDGKKVRLWNAASGANLGHDFEATRNYITAMALSPDGKTLLVGDGEGGFQLWDLAARQPRAERVPAHRGAISAVAFSPDGKLCATGGWSKEARVWEVASGRPRGPLLKHNGFVTAVAFSPVDPILATSSQDQKVRLWDPSTGTPLGPPLELNGEGGPLAFAPGGRALAVTCLNHTMVFEVPAPAQGKAGDLLLWVEAITGRSLDEQEAVAPVGLEAWESRRRELVEQGATPKSMARPPDWETSHHLGSAIAAEQAGDPSAALWHLNHLIASQPRQPIAWSMKASLLADAGREDEARAALAQAIEAVEDRGELARLASRLGALESEVGHWNQASRAFEKAVACDPNNAQLSYNLDLALLAAGDRVGLRRANDALIIRNGNTADPNLANSLAWSCVLAPGAVADPEAPVRLAEVAVKRSPEAAKPLILNTLGAALYRAGRFEEAIRRLEEGIQKRNGVSEPQDWAFLALAHHRLKHREQALRWLEKLRSYHPSPSPGQFWSELEIRLFRDEAEAVILYDPIFPTDPFAP